MVDPRVDGAQSVLKSQHFRRWLREPLLHFIFLGLILFGVYGFVRHSRIDTAQPGQIEITADDLRQMTVYFQSKWGRPPSPEELGNIVQDRVKEEILYREGLLIGLDKGDVIVKRRMVQKMDFLAEDLSDLREPTRDELKEFLGKNKERFTVPGRVSFRHLYFSFDKHGKQTGETAADVLKRIANKPAELPDATPLGDPFMFQDYYGDSSFDEIAKNFGPPFAKALFQLKPGLWQGPIESGYGWHVIFVDSLTPAHVPELEEVESDVKTAWVGERRAEVKRKAFEVMRSRYKIVIAKAPANPSDVAVKQPDVKGDF